MATSFLKDIRPYFTPCYRAHMISAGGFDLWVQEDVQSNFEGIFGSVEAERMPMEGCGEGVWDPVTRDRFKQDFQSWKAGGFQP
jgi:hypothetical protein